MLARFAIVLIFIVGCSHDKVRSDRGRYNQLASVAFVDNFEKYDFGTLSGSEKCILKETIANDLDELNDWRFVEVDNRFRIRTYHAPYLDLDFAFVKHGDRFSFITLPDVVKYIYGIRHRYKEQHNKWVLKDSSAVFTLNSVLLDNFLNDNAIAIKELSPFEKATLLNRLLPEIFSSPFFRPISRFEFKDMIDAQINAGEMTNYDYEKIRGLIDHAHPSVVELCNIFFMERVGWVLLNYPDKNLEENKVKVDAYFIVFRERVIITRADENTKYIRCREQYE